MADGDAGLEAEMTHQSRYIVGIGPRPVVAQFRRTGRKVESAKVDGDDGVIARELLDDVPEGVPMLGKAVNAKQQRPRAGFDLVKRHVVHRERPMFQRHLVLEVHSVTP